MSEITNGTSEAVRSRENDSTDDDDGAKPSELYGTYTWNIDKFQLIDKRELRSNVFEVGGFEWSILIYPQGCDVCNHLSLFLCVANSDKLLPGWSHLAQFTISLTNEDPKPKNYSDTLHRFWKKEHDWGWKKFIELARVHNLYDRFVDDSGFLIIKAQVQVIRENMDRPFRCLDGQYRRELARVYLKDVEQIFLSFAEEKRSKLVKLMEDKNRWSSLTAYWLGLDENSRKKLSREKMGVILKQVVKHFFIEKEVTSTLVIESLYYGLKSLEGEGSRIREEFSKLVQSSEKEESRENAEKEPLARIVKVDKEVFCVVDDVMSLVEKAVLEPFLEKDSVNVGEGRLTDSGRANAEEKYDMERNEKLIEFGQRVLEIFVLDHIIFDKINVPYEEAMILKMQEELIREEEEEKKKINKVSKSKKKIKKVFVGTK